MPFGRIWRESAYKYFDIFIQRRENAHERRRSQRKSGLYMIIGRREKRIGHHEWSLKGGRHVGRGQHVANRARERHASLGHDDGEVRPMEGSVHIMKNRHGRQAMIIAQATHRREDAHRIARVEIGRRLIEQQELWLLSYGTRETCHLPLAIAEHRHRGAFQGGDAHGTDGIVD